MAEFIVRGNYLPDGVHTYFVPKKWHEKFRRYLAVRLLRSLPTGDKLTITTEANRLPDVILSPPFK